MKPFNAGTLRFRTNPREAAFAKILTDRRQQWQYQSRTFVFGINPRLTYTPDFYVPSTKTYYEVIGSRQALHQIQTKLKQWCQAYPDLKLQLVTPTGMPLSKRITNGPLVINTPTGKLSQEFPQRSKRYPQVWKQLRTIAYNRKIPLEIFLQQLVQLAEKEASRP